MIWSDGFDGVDGGVNGFRFAARDGLLEAMGAIFRDLTVNAGTFDSIKVAGESSFEGDIVVGDVWNKDGSLNNVNGRGSFLAINRNLGPDKYEIRAHKLRLFGDMSIGDSINGGLSNVFMYGRRYIERPSYTHYNNVLQGNYKPSELFNELDAYLSNSHLQEKCGVNGTLMYYEGGKYISITLTYAVYLQNSPQKTHVLCGSLDGIVNIAVTATAITIMNATHNNQVASISGNNFVIANFFFV